jgi:hypothetical protein
MSRLKLAELTSGIGALVLGIGLGGLFAVWIAPVATVVLIAGMVTHAFGMWDKHRLEAQTSAAGARWVAVLYWVCWLMLAALLVFLFIRGSE